jgi:DnaJ-class molecular chaperone
VNNLLVSKCETCYGSGTVHTQSSCSACGGTGLFIPVYERTCRYCNGKGQTLQTKKGGIVISLCLHCHGTGIFVFRAAERRCIRCLGTGKFCTKTRCPACEGTGAKSLNNLGTYWPERQLSK